MHVDLGPRNLPTLWIAAIGMTALAAILLLLSLRHDSGVAAASTPMQNLAATGKAVYAPAVRVPPDVHRSLKHEQSQAAFADADAANRAPMPTVRPDLFRAPEAVGSRLLERSSAATNPAQRPTRSIASHDRPEPHDPFDGLVYTGLGRIDGQALALIENRKTRAGRYVRPGDRFNGFVVRRFDAGALILVRHGVSRSLAMNADYRLTPLDRDAPYPKAPVPASVGAGAPAASAVPAAANAEVVTKRSEAAAQTTQETRTAAEALERAAATRPQAEDQGRALLEHEGR